MKNRQRSWLPMLVAVPLLSASGAFGQINTATVSGRITDATSAVIPNTQVRITNQGTGAAKTILSNANGEYSFTFLMPGTYDVAVSAKDFQPMVRQGVAVLAGQQVSLDFQLKVGAITQTETVSAQAVSLSTESSHQLQGLTNIEVTQLPDSKLDWTNLLIMGTGISKVVGLQGAGSVGGIVMNGMSSSAMNVTIDGTNSSNDPELPTFGFYGGMNIINQLGSDAIAEVSVVKGIMPASVGNTLSGNINLITKSGTNSFHGSVFELNDVAAYDARNQFLAKKPGSTFNQYGGSLGGPIVKEKLFFFGSYEGVRWSRLAPLSANVPTPYLESIAPSIFSSQWSLYPSVPQPAGAPTALTALFFGAGSKVNNDANIVARGDYYISPSNQLTFRYTRATPYQVTPRVITVNSQSYSGTDQTFNAAFVHTTGHLTSSTRFGYNRIRQARTDNGYASDLEGVSFSGISSGGAEVFHLLGGTQTYHEDVTISHGHHLIQFGGIAQRQAAGRPDVNTSTFSYSSLADFQANLPSSVQITFDVPNINLSTFQVGGYVQDDYKLLPNLTLNIGLRYDLFTVPASSQVFNRGIDPARRQLGYGFGPYRPGDSLYDGDHNNFQPRVGFAWSLGSNRKTVIRGGAGFFVSPHPLYAGIDNDRQSSAEVPFRSTTSRSTNLAGAISYPIPPAQFIPTLNRLIGAKIFSANIASADAIATNYPDPYSMQWMLGVEHEFGFGVVFTANYVANRGLKLIANYFGNAPDRITGVAPDPTIGQFLVVTPIDASGYQSFQTSLSKRFSNGLVFNINYTHSSNRSFGAGDVAAYQVSYLTQPNNPRADLGPTPFSQPNLFNETLVYQIPFARWTGAHGRAAKALIDGWQVSEVFSDTSGLPLNVTDSASIYPQDRPDSGAGNAINSNYRSTLLYLNAAAFSRVPIVPASGAESHPGNLSRNAYRLPSIWNVDVSVAKSFSFTEKAHIQFRADFLNAFNHTNLTGLTTNINSGSFGRFTSATARTIQLGARIQF